MAYICDFCPGPVRDRQPSTFLMAVPNVEVDKTGRQRVERLKHEPSKSACDAHLDRLVEWVLSESEAAGLIRIHKVVM